ncbi:zinc-dependent alcohol dehydrogenase family protein [Deinococcus roseus]|uniref:2-deoxy-scyllo-inosamine dehydrogenase n=1 Tax=Deinococcus roseus TaxID=392414 RepID=A0ABQ2D5G8_9DEIO|nr:zinc-dependent alcohol dehydrogenase family protein [Deinococcus roseus]GGJ46876.1 2-deoxy-scyllo-inosamine dehydrogenase [Deinococcus roseus]
MTTSATRTMHAALITQPGVIEYREVELPEPQAGEVRIKILLTGVCGTDAHLLEGHFQATLPLIPGHEIVGVIDAVGKEVQGFTEGQRVVLDPDLNCGTCIMCQKGMRHQCLHYEAIGVTRAGGFAQYVVAPASVVYDASDLEPEVAVFAEPLGCVAWGITRLRPDPGSTALLYGAGGIGLLLMQALLASGVSEIAVVDTQPSRLQLAQQLGAKHAFLASSTLNEELKDLYPYGFDVVTEATGVPRVQQTMIDQAIAGGKILIFGVAPENARIEVSPYEIFRKDLTILGSFSLNSTIPLALRWMRSGQVQVKELITDTLPLGKLHEAIGQKIAASAGSIKSIVSPDL